MSFAFYGTLFYGIEYSGHSCPYMKVKGAGTGTKMTKYAALKFFRNLSHYSLKIFPSAVALISDVTAIIFASNLTFGHDKCENQFCWLQWC